MESLSQKIEKHEGCPLLKLKEIEIKDPHTERIYGITGETIERFNIFLDDFYQTREILLEQIEKIESSASPSGTENDATESRESIREIEKRITEILVAMNEMARQNPELLLIEHR